MTTPRTAGRLLCTMLVAFGVVALSPSAATAAAVTAAGSTGSGSATSLAGRAMYRAPSPSSSRTPSASSTPKTGIHSLTVTGPGLRRPLTFRQDHQTSQYNAMLAEVTWMDGRPGDFIDTSPTDLGPDYTVTLLTDGKPTATYDLFPDVPGGPRAHRQATDTMDEAWFFAPVDMANALASVGVKIPAGQTAATAGFTQPTIATVAPRAHLTTLLRESRTAVILAGIGAAAILFLLGFAARRSRVLDRRATTPPAIARLQSMKARAASGGGATLRRAAPVPGRSLPELRRPDRPTNIARTARPADPSGRVTGQAHIPAASAVVAEPTSEGTGARPVPPADAGTSVATTGPIPPAPRASAEPID